MEGAWLPSNPESNRAASCSRVDGWSPEVIEVTIKNSVSGFINKTTWLGIKQNISGNDYSMISAEIAMCIINSERIMFKMYNI